MDTEPKLVCLDIQGYPCSSGFIPKELAVYDGERFSTFLFKPPYSKSFLKEEDLKIVTYLETQYHGLLWESGFIDLNNFENILTSIRLMYDNPKFMVKGDSKANALKRIFSSDLIFRIPLKTEPKLSKFKKQLECYHHKDFNVWHCACNNVKLLYNFRYCLLNDMK